MENIRLVVELQNGKIKRVIGNALSVEVTVVDHDDLRKSFDLDPIENLEECPCLPETTYQYGNVDKHLEKIHADYQQEVNGVASMELLEGGDASGLHQMEALEQVA